MKDNNSSRNAGAGGGLGFPSALQIVFIVLKLCHVINWPWLWVLAPTWISIALVIIVAIFLAIPAIINRRK